MNKLFLVLCLFGLAAQPAFAHDGKDGKEKVAMTAEQRQKMAEAHEKMAACLRTDKSAEECQEELMKTCKGVCKGHCPMDGHHGKMKHGAKAKSEAKE